MDLIDDPQLREALHAAVSDGPEAPSLDTLLLGARRARRGRTARRTVGSLAVAAVLGTVAFTGAQLLQAPATGGDDRTGIAGSTKDQDQASLDLGVHVTPAGKLVADPGVSILRTVADPLDRRPDGRSWGVVTLRDTGAEDVEVWGLVDWNPAGTFASVEPARDRFAVFEDWLDYEVAASTGSPEPHAIAFRPDGTIVATGSTRIERVRLGIDLGVEAGSTRTAAAEILVEGDRRWVLARLQPGARARYVELPERRVADFAELVSRASELWARETAQ